MKRFTTAGALAATVIAIPASALAHGGPPVEVSTSSESVTNTQLFEGPCGGGAGLVALDFRDVFHVTEFADGHVNLSGNSAGTFDFEPFDESEPGSSGRFRNGFSFVTTQNTVTNPSVLVVVGKDDNGDQVKFQISSQFVVSNGEVRVDNFTVDCG